MEAGLKYADCVGKKMGQTYVVKQGDYVSKIAREFGFADYRRVWDHPENSALKAERKSPNVLSPGDRIFIPDRQERFEMRATADAHTFVLNRVPLKLCLQLLDMSSEPLKNIECELTIDGQTMVGKTDGAGKLEKVIPSASRTGTLKINDPSLPLLEFDLDLAVGHIDPVATASGQRGRLNNLGYGAGPRPGFSEVDNEALFRSALEEFQCDHQLAVDGKCGPATQSKLKEVHGC